MRLKLFFLICFVFVSSLFATAVDDSILNVNWADDYKSLSFTVFGDQSTYPDILLKNQFPPQGEKPKIEITDNWPFVLMKARWTASKKGWPEKYKDEVIDLVLMFACNAQVYEHIYPEIILSSKYTAPLQFSEEAKHPEFNLAEVLRGKLAEYEITANAGLGARNYTIKTAIRIGTSDDGKAVFYHDEPYYISDYLKQREFLFAAYDSGDYIHFETVMLSECKPKSFLKKETLKRIRNSSKYFIQRMYESLDDAPTIEEIENLLNSVKNTASSFKTQKD